MRILMIAPTPLFQPRGTPFSTLWRARALSRLGHQIDIVAYHVGEAVEVENVRVFRIPSIPFIREVKIGSALQKLILGVFLLGTSFAVFFRGRYDGVHGHDEGAFIGALLKILTGTPLVYDMHTSIPGHLVDFDHRLNRFRPLIRIAAWMERMIVARADQIVAISPDLEVRARRVSGDGRVRTIENIPFGEEKGAVQADRLRALKREIGLKDEVVVLYTGTFADYQRIDLLIQAVPKVVREYRGKVKFVLVGGDLEEIEEMRALATSLEVAQHVLFTGKRPPQEMSLFLGFANILVSPRVWAGNTPLKLYSYLRSGKPIVATNTLTHTQVLSEETAILTEPNPESFASGILRVLSDEALRRRVGAEGKRLAERRYSEEYYLASVARLYEDLP